LNERCAKILPLLVRVDLAFLSDLFVGLDSYQNDQMSGYIRVKVSLTLSKQAIAGG
jgi:hypothetical protein